MGIHVSLRECIPDRWMVEPSSLSPLNGSFPKSILRIIVYWGLYWGTLVLWESTKSSILKRQQLRFLDKERG